MIHNQVPSHKFRQLAYPIAWSTASDFGRDIGYIGNGVVGGIFVY